MKIQVTINGQKYYISSKMEIVSNDSENVTLRNRKSKEENTVPIAGLRKVQ